MHASLTMQTPVCASPIAQQKQALTAAEFQIHKHECAMTVAACATRCRCNTPRVTQARSRNLHFGCKWPQAVRSCAHTDACVSGCAATAPSGQLLRHACIHQRAHHHRSATAGKVANQTGTLRNHNRASTTAAAAAKSASQRATGIPVADTDVRLCRVGLQREGRAAHSRGEQKCEIDQGMAERAPENTFTQRGEGRRLGLA